MADILKSNLHKKLNVKTLLEWTIFLFLIFGGMYASLKVGISWDEEVEFKTYSLNLEVFKGLIHGDSTPYQALALYHDRYYGVGFHWLSHGFGNLLSLFNLRPLEFSELGSRLLWAHVINYLAFIASGILFRQSLLIITSDRVIASLGMLVYLLWPYLLGHAMMNVKDIPFTLAWMACTFQSLRILRPPIKPPTVFQFLILGLLTGWLISIRVSGVLIFIQYVFFALFLIALVKDELHLYQAIKKIAILGITFLVSAAVCLYILYPILWYQPLEIFNAIAYMGSHPWMGNTLTAGEFIEPKTRLIHYLILWLVVKLPAIMLLGIFLLPYALYVGMKSRKLFQSSVMVIALFSVMAILCSLIYKRVALYNELRQILFIEPLLLLAAIISLYIISRKFTIVALGVTAALMVIDNFSLYPYQYSYINEIARYSQIGKKYETDYFGLSVANTARWLNRSGINGSSQCLYVPSTHLWKYELDPMKFPCMAIYPGDLSLIKGRFLFYAQLRGNLHFPVPAHCRQIHIESRALGFSNTKLNMGALYACNS